MSLVPKCARCDNPLDPYGRDGGDAYCRPCIEEERAAYAVRRAARLKAEAEARKAA